MKLRNKKTGEIGFVYTGLNGEVKVCSEHDDNHTCLGEYSFLSELIEEWEDVPEETKEYWTIDWVCTGVTTNKYSGDDVDDFNKSIGNYFETKEEAELALRKLKAWKQLKDDGITYSLDEGNGIPYIIIHSKEETGTVQKVMRIIENLTLLFGGEDE